MEKTIIVASPIKRLNNGFIHYVAYIFNGKEFQLFAPCYSKKSAIEVGMSYNSLKSGLPPYTFKVYLNDMELQKSLTNTLNKIGITGLIELKIINGYNTPPYTFTI
jgi:hypothetical protein